MIIKITVKNPATQTVERINAKKISFKSMNIFASISLMIVGFIQLQNINKKNIGTNPYNLHILVAAGVSLTSNNR